MTALPGLLGHAVHCFLPRLLEQFGVTFQFAADQVLQSGHHVATEVLGAHRAALDDAEMFNDLLAGHAADVGQNHKKPLEMMIVSLNRQL